MALSRPKHGFESRWGRHFILRAPNCGQVLERVGRYGGSNKLFSVERYTITEEQLLQPLFLIERGLHPEVRRPRQNAFCERQDALHVEFLKVDGMFVDLRERELLAEPVSLPLVARQVDRFRVQVRLVQAVQFLLNHIPALRFAFEVTR